jgi:transcriptional regulator with XRE-family HTH domain
MSGSTLTTPTDVGALIRKTRRARNLRLEDLSLAAGVGVRFLSELERGKPTARLGETLRVLATLGIRLSAQEPDDQIA